MEPLGSVHSVRCFGISEAGPRWLGVALGQLATALGLGSHQQRRAGPLPATSSPPGGFAEDGQVPGHSGRALRCLCSLSSPAEASEGQSPSSGGRGRQLRGPQGSSAAGRPSVPGGTTENRPCPFSSPPATAQRPNSHCSRWRRRQLCPRNSGGPLAGPPTAPAPRAVLEQGTTGGAAPEAVGGQMASDVLVSAVSPTRRTAPAETAKVLLTTSICWPFQT